MGITDVAELAAHSVFDEFGTDPRAELATAEHTPGAFMQTAGIEEPGLRADA